MRKALIASVACISGSVAAQDISNEWIPVATSVTGAVWRLRYKDMQNQIEMKPKVRIYIDYSKDNPVKYRSAKRFFAIKCVATSYQLLSSFKYKSDGSVANSYTDLENSYLFEVAVPVSMAAAVVQAACPSTR